jgi:hypothetical protein
MNKITNLDEYLEVERQADELYEKSHQEDQLHRLIEMLSRYEEAHPEEIGKIYGDATNLPESEDPFEDWDWRPEDNTADY